MVKLVNTLVSKTSAARLPGSIPGIPTKPTKLSKNKVFISDPNLVRVIIDKIIFLVFSLDAFSCWT